MIGIHIMSIWSYVFQSGVDSKDLNLWKGFFLFKTAFKSLAEFSKLLMVKKDKSGVNFFIYPTDFQLFIKE